MADLCQGNDAVEGDAVAGQSRKPLVHYGRDVAPDGTRCLKYIAHDDVKARVEIACESPTFIPHASISRDDQLICNKAMLYSLDKKPATKVGPGSATHQTNHWSLTKRTAAVVTMPHQSLVNGFQNSQKLKLAAKP